MRNAGRGTGRKEFDESIGLRLQCTGKTVVPDEGDHHEQKYYIYTCSERSSQLNASDKPENSRWHLDDTLAGRLCMCPSLGLEIGSRIRAPTGIMVLFKIRLERRGTVTAVGFIP